MSVEDERNELLYARYQGIVNQEPEPSLASLPIRLKELHG